LRFFLCGEVEKSVGRRTDVRLIAVDDVHADEKTMKVMPLKRHKRFQNAGVSRRWWMSSTV
jgi:hypothetical protein